VVVVRCKEGTKFLEHPQQTGAAWTAVEPDGERCLLFVPAGGYEYVVDLAGGECGIEVARVDGFAEHALRVKAEILVQGRQCLRLAWKV
jgi:hypothetical protein